ncbi:MAG: serine/threonine protein kinase [Sandaracinaceae bacterium]|nr:serine/threonine protein kinase [Sandaracinaceae bacterium]
MTRFGKYELLERIGIGGMAEVFKAKIYGAEGFERLIAIKRILPNLTEDDDFVQMFVDEAKIAVRLNHPNIVGIDDLGKAEGTLFIAMEYVHGKDLRAIYDVDNARGTSTPVGISCHIVMKMCEALHHAHFATGPRGEPLNVIHRDVSPQNVLLSFDGEVKVADFGLAKARGRMVQTQAGVVKGKLAYMSPEQLRGDEIDHRVDVFGLGIVLFELLAGVRLFLGPSDMDTLRRVYEAKVPALRPLNPEVHPELEAIVRRALAKDRDERYPTALALFEDLQTHVYGQGLYAGTGALRQYLQDAFPGAAPAAMGLPPFAPSAPPPRPTHRPSRPEIVPPASGPHDIPPAPPVPDVDAVLDELETNQLSAPAIDADAFLVEVAETYEESLATERPPDLDDLIASMPHPALTTQRVATPPEESQVQSADRGLPSTPPGVYDGPYDAGPDTNPAPAPGPGDHLPLAEAPWEDTTEFEPVGVPMTTVEARPDDLDEWGDDATQVVDPRSADGNGR